MFKFNGISSDDMGCIVEEEALLLTRSSQSTEIISIEGRDGSEIDYLGYRNVEIPLSIQLLEKNKLDKIYSWLNGTGQLVYKGKKTKASFPYEISPQRTASIYILGINFIRSPFWTLENDEFLDITSQTSVINEGNVYSKPIIRLEKQASNTVEITIGNIRFIYEFPDDENYVEIDCSAETVLYDNLSRNRQIEIGFAFPTLPVGESSVIIHSGDPIIKIKEKDRWI